MTRPASDVAREWVLANDDGSGVGMTPEKIASLTALIERERLEAIAPWRETLRRVTNAWDDTLGERWSEVTRSMTASRAQLAASGAGKPEGGGDNG